jgi:large subunit ribosomal protein L31
MKKEIHPKYHADSIAKCACGAEFAIGSTQKEISIEVCSACHPFFTGNTKLLDTAGRVERFKTRKAAATVKKGK